ncbi:saccharopine dehydrogenase C-terminal domain-containing protein [uncultured Thiodictyon sp.]|uniref:homospermidine synthase n=1 Tax=uncultured Thiodictyon sp. TaxID=1846217 RepID=UPI0025DE7FB9|nr:saccharopine dehydrogenase C-terminal domain-containing protein [uncultured Thiodictyon sp.]
MYEPSHRSWVDFHGRLLILGFGGIGQGVLPLLLRHVRMAPEQIAIVSASERGAALAVDCGVAFAVEPLTRDNYRQVLESRLGPGDFLLNLSINVCSLELIAWCQDHQVLYLDACIEPWLGGYCDQSVPPANRTNYALREAALALRQPDGPRTTAVVTHGVNPGLVSHFVKQALLDLAAELCPTAVEPQNRAQWAALARRLEVRAIHIAERDTHTSRQRKQPGEFVNTWSVDGFVGEGCQPAELGWGSHERHWPSDAHRHTFGCDAAIWLGRPGAGVRVRSWTPLEGPYHGFLITHGESISIADYLTVRDGDDTLYRPTVHYAYHPCDDAVLSLHELAGKGWAMQPRQRQLESASITAGTDELGVLLLGHARDAYWYGSRLSIEQARALCPHNNATTLQTCAGVLAGLVWALRHPAAGIVEPEEMDFREVLAVAIPYLGEMVGVYGDWTPLKGRNRLFAEDVDADDPWQFKNILVD